MQWHQKNTIGANYADKDAASARGICQGCALGSAHHYPTNQHYVKSDTPHDPGQQFVMDAFTHHSIAHLFTDLASRQVYPVFTKSKLVVELTEMGEGIHNELLAWVMWCVGLNIMLVGWILMCAPQCASLTDSTS